MKKNSEILNDVLITGFISAPHGRGSSSRDARRKSNGTLLRVPEFVNQRREQSRRLAASLKFGQSILLYAGANKEFAAAIIAGGLGV
jgi:hypothetical protein